MKIKHTSFNVCKLWGKKHGSSVIGTEEDIAAPAFYYSQLYRTQAVTICTSPTTRTFRKCVEKFLVVTSEERGGVLLASSM